MSVVTFYSYKGGVGRTLALANVAVLLARQGARVLVIDWDLEAPGLEEYFDDFQIKADGRGLLFLLKDRGASAGHVWHLTSTVDGTTLDLLPSGRDEEDYYPTLERFDWEGFYRDGGGEFLEELRAQWDEAYDYVLIDSRTGLSDAGGICTIQLPDIIVGMFTATRQSARGVRDVLDLARASRQNLAYARPAFSVVPVPCRVEPAEGNLAYWMDQFSELMSDLTDDWRPRGVLIGQILHALKVEHTPSLTHGTTIVKDDPFFGASQPMGAYRRLADLIATELGDLSVLGIEGPKAPPEWAEAVQTRADDPVASMPAPPPTRVPEHSSPKTDGISSRLNRGRLTERETRRLKGASGLGINIPPEKYDVFISVPPGSSEARWVEDIFLDIFNHELERFTGRTPRVYFDRHELSVSSKFNFTSQAQAALASTRVLLAFLSPRFYRSTSNVQELEFFDKEGDGFIVPVILSGEEAPEMAKMVYSVNLEKFFVTGDYDSLVRTQVGGGFLSEVQRIARNVTELLSDAARR